MLALSYTHTRTKNALRKLPENIRSIGYPSGGAYIESALSRI